jgi:protein-S-isoprenylcysteine O-methyltransferase Ste14
MQKLWPIGISWPAWTRWAGLALVALALLLVSWAIMTFGRHATTVHPRGASNQLVNSGPFRYTRNPMYVSLMLLYLGLTLALRMPWGLVLVIPVFLALNFVVIVPEEKYLSSRFGNDYDLYKQRVRRWV